MSNKEKRLYMVEFEFPRDNHRVAIVYSDSIKHAQEEFLQVWNACVRDEIKIKDVSFYLETVTILY